MPRRQWQKGDRVRCYGRPWLGAGVVVDAENVIVAWPEAPTSATEQVSGPPCDWPPEGVLHGVHSRSELRPETYRPRKPPARPPRPTLYWYAAMGDDTTAHGAGEEPAT